MKDKEKVNNWENKKSWGKQEKKKALSKTGGNKKESFSVNLFKDVKKCIKKWQKYFDDTEATLDPK